MTTGLGETSLEQCLTDIERLRKDRGSVIRIQPTQMRVTCGRIVRAAPFMWYWVFPNRPKWSALGPFWTYRGCRRECEDERLPVAPGWAHWHDIVEAFS